MENEIYNVFELKYYRNFEKMSINVKIVISQNSAGLCFCWYLFMYVIL